MNDLICYLDTEFTDLIIDPKLLSIGIVTSTNHEFYAEVTDLDRINLASEFVKGVVLPQFGWVEDAACTYAELCHRLAEFFTALSTSSANIIVAFDFQTDWQLARQAMTDAEPACTDARRWKNIHEWLIPLNIHNTSASSRGEAASDSYYKSQALKEFSRHHALCDARALRVAHEGAMSLP